MKVRQLQEMGYNLQNIVKRLTANQNLLKLLYYTDKDPFSQQDLTKEQVQKEIFEKLIKIVPRVGAEAKEGAQSIIAFRVIRSRKTTTNSEFQNITLAFEIFVPLTQWILKDVSLRPFLIMSEIQKSLEGKTIEGLGRIEFGGFDLNFLTEEMSCYEMTFNMVAYE